MSEYIWLSPKEFAAEAKKHGAAKTVDKFLNEIDSMQEHGTRTEREILFYMLRMNMVVMTHKEKT